MGEGSWRGCQAHPEPAGVALTKTLRQVKHKAGAEAEAARSVASTMRLNALRGATRRCKSTRAARLPSVAPARLPMAPAAQQAAAEASVGTVYGTPETKLDVSEFRNVDGERLEDGRYAARGPRGAYSTTPSRWARAMNRMVWP